jgi:hypothetical protein
VDERTTLRRGDGRPAVEPATRRARARPGRARASGLAHRDPCGGWTQRNGPRAGEGSPSHGSRALSGRHRTGPRRHGGALSTSRERARSRRGDVGRRGCGERGGEALARVREACPRTRPPRRGRGRHARRRRRVDDRRAGRTRRVGGVARQSVAREWGGRRLPRSRDPRRRQRRGLASIGPRRLGAGVGPRGDRLALPGRRSPRRASA